MKAESSAERANLSRTSRASLVSEISASIAHELNQPLSSLLSNAQACFRWLSAPTPNIENAISSIERVVRDGRATDAAIRNIRSLYKQQPSVKGSFNMVELLGEIVGLLKEDASRRQTPTSTKSKNRFLRFSWIDTRFSKSSSIWSPTRSMRCRTSTDSRSCVFTFGTTKAAEY
jgi:signal transduction histidine kinase